MPLNFPRKGHSPEDAKRLYGFIGILPRLSESKRELYIQTGHDLTAMIRLHGIEGVLRNLSK